MTETIFENEDEREEALAAGLAGDRDEDGAPDRPGEFSPGKRPRGPRDAGGNR